MLIDQAPYELTVAKKAPLLLAELNSLTAHHRKFCSEYESVVAAQWPNYVVANQLAAVPYLAVSLFKHLSLKSIPDSEVFKTLYSSGTTGNPSKIALDRETAGLQSKTLVKIMQHWLGKERRPMLIIDKPSILDARNSFSARAAGIKGLSFMGRNHCYALNEDMSVNIDVVQQFCSEFAAKPVLVFGFTFMVWQYFVEQLKQSKQRISLPNAILLHSGGWKKLEDRAVSNATFKQAVLEYTDIPKVHNFYGLVEQVGSIFVECERGHLHCSSYSDVLVRDAETWRPLPLGREGILQLMSVLPKSYPGHSLLTEDRAVILGEDDCPCGRKGKYFEIKGRLPKVEMRGCSDTFRPTVRGQS